MAGHACDSDSCPASRSTIPSAGARVCALATGWCGACGNTALGIRRVAAILRRRDACRFVPARSYRIRQAMTANRAVALKAFECAELAWLDLATALQDPMPRFNRPLSCIPGQSLKDLFKRSRWHGTTQQHPLERFSPVRGRIFDCVSSKHVDFDQAARARPRCPQSHAEQRNVRRAVRCGMLPPAGTSRSVLPRGAVACTVS